MAQPPCRPAPADGVSGTVDPVRAGVVEYLAGGEPSRLLAGALAQEPQPVGCELDIVVEHRDPLAAGLEDAVIESGTHSAIDAEFDPADAMRPRDCLGSVGGSVVDHDHFKIGSSRKSLGRNRLQDALEEVVPIPVRDDD